MNAFVTKCCIFLSPSNHFLHSLATDKLLLFSFHNNRNRRVCEFQSNCIVWYLGYLPCYDDTMPSNMIFRIVCMHMQRNAVHFNQRRKWLPKIFSRQKSYGKEEKNRKRTKHAHQNCFIASKMRHSFRYYDINCVSFSFLSNYFDMLASVKKKNISAHFFLSILTSVFFFSLFCRTLF